MKNKKLILIIMLALSFGAQMQADGEGQEFSNAWFTAIKNMSKIILPKAKIVLGTWFAYTLGTYLAKNINNSYLHLDRPINQLKMALKKKIYTSEVASLVKEISGAPLISDLYNLQKNLLYDNRIYGGIADFSIPISVACATYLLTKRPIDMLGIKDEDLKTKMQFAFSTMGASAANGAYAKWKSLMNYDSMNRRGEKAINDSISLTAPYENEKKIITLPEANYYISRLASRKKNGLGPIPLLFYGPPGNGKTTAARDIARILGVNFYEVNSANLASMYVNGVAVGTNGVLRYIRKYAPKGSVVFLDEFETIAKNRSTMGNSSSSSSENNSTNATMQLVNDLTDEGYILIGATNMRSLLDSAVVRRFKKNELCIANPTRNFRFSISKLNFEKEGVEIDLSTKLYIADNTPHHTASEMAILCDDIIEKHKATGEKSANIHEPSSRIIIDECLANSLRNPQTLETKAQEERKENLIENLAKAHEERMKYEDQVLKNPTDETTLILRKKFAEQETDYLRMLKSNKTSSKKIKEEIQKARNKVAISLFHNRISDAIVNNSFDDKWTEIKDEFEAITKFESEATSSKIETDFIQKIQDEINVINYGIKSEKDVKSPDRTKAQSVVKELEKLQESLKNDLKQEKERLKSKEIEALKKLIDNKKSDSNEENSSDPFKKESSAFKKKETEDTPTKLNEYLEKKTKERGEYLEHHVRAPVELENEIREIKQEIEFLKAFNDHTGHEENKKKLILIKKLFNENKQFHSSVLSKENILGILKSDEDKKLTIENGRILPTKRSSLSKSIEISKGLWPALKNSGITNSLGGLFTVAGWLLQSIPGIGRLIPSSWKTRGVMSLALITAYSYAKSRRRVYAHFDADIKSGAEKTKGLLRTLNLRAERLAEAQEEYIEKNPQDRKGAQFSVEAAREKLSLPFFMHHPELLNEKYKKNKIEELTATGFGNGHTYSRDNAHYVARELATPGSGGSTGNDKKE